MKISREEMQAGEKDNSAIGESITKYPVKKKLKQQKAFYIRQRLKDI